MKILDGIQQNKTQKESIYFNSRNTHRLFISILLFSAYNEETKRINLPSSSCRYGVKVSQGIANPSSGLNRYLGSNPSAGVL